MGETTLPYPVGTHLTGVHAVRKTPMSGTLVGPFGTTGSGLRVQKDNGVMGVMDAETAVRSDVVIVADWFKANLPHLRSVTCQRLAESLCREFTISGNIPVED